MSKYKYPAVLVTFGDIRKCPGVVDVEEKGIAHIGVTVTNGRHIQPIVKRLPVALLVEFRVQLFPLPRRHRG